MSAGRFGAAREGRRRSGGGFPFFKVILILFILAIIFYPLYSYNIAKYCLFATESFAPGCVDTAGFNTIDGNFLDKLVWLSDELGFGIK